MTKECYEKEDKLTKQVYFFESNLLSNNILSFIRDLLSKMDLDSDEFSFSLSEAPFDINDENTWMEGMLPVAKLFYNLIDDLIRNSKIDATEIEKLKTKEYTKSLFKSTDYPAIANNVDDNKGNSFTKDTEQKNFILTMTLYMLQHNSLNLIEMLLLHGIEIICDNSKC